MAKPDSLTKNLHLIKNFGVYLPDSSKQQMMQQSNLRAGIMYYDKHGNPSPILELKPDDFFYYNSIIVRIPGTEFPFLYRQDSAIDQSFINDKLAIHPDWDHYYMVQWEDKKEVRRGEKIYNGYE